jgi:hypothetical protein
MTLTLISDATRPHDASRHNRAYTEQEDATIRAMMAERRSYHDIAAALGRPESGVKSRAYLVSDVRKKPGPPRHILAATCPRCGIILSNAPAATGDVCGWCERERR